MRYKSKKRQKSDRMVAYERVLFLAEFPWCWFCENARSEAVHEIAAGTGNRPKAFLVRFAWAAACHNCNCNELTQNGPKGKWTYARQYAVKWINDRPHFNRVELNRILRPKSPEKFITMAEVAIHVCRLLDGKESRGRF